MKLALIVLAAIGLATARAVEEETTLVKVGDLAPAFTTTNTENEPISTEALKGKVVLVNFFATWCGPCLAEMPHLEAEVWQKFKDRGLVVVAIGREHSTAEMTKFKADKKLTMAVVPDPKREIFSKYATKYIPRNFLIGRDGKIIFASTGFNRTEFDSMIALIAAELAKGG
jgi:peroxiredoxin